MRDCCSTPVARLHLLVLGINSQSCVRCDLPAAGVLHHLSVEKAKEQRQLHLTCCVVVL